MTRRRYVAFTQGSDYKQSRGTPATATIRMSIQPLAESERQQLLEIYKVTGTHKGYTSADVRPVGDPPTPTPADEILDGTQLYRVAAIDAHTWGLAHRKVFLARTVDDG